mgnify:CR=1 FL=1
MYNGATNETGRPQVMWIMMFTSWCPYCESEVPYTQEFYDIYEDSGLVVIGMGFEWGSPYNCEEWTAGYGLTYPLIDDTDFGNDYDFGGSGFNLFTDNGVPHNVVIDHNMEIVYSVPGYWEEGMDIDISMPDALPGGVKFNWAPFKPNEITSLEQQVEQKGEPYYGKWWKRGVRYGAEELGAPDLYDDWYDAFYGKDPRDAYSDLPLDWASQLAALEKKEWLQKLEY